MCGRCHRRLKLLEQLHSILGIEPTAAPECWMPRAGRLHTPHSVQNTRSRYCTTKSGLATTVWELVHRICRGSRLSGTKGGGWVAAAAQGEGHVLPRRVNCSRRPETYRPFRNPVQNVAGFVVGLPSSTVSGISPDKLYRRTALLLRSFSSSIFPFLLGFPPRFVIFPRLGEELLQLFVSPLS